MRWMLAVLSDGLRSLSFGNNNNSSFFPIIIIIEKKMTGDRQIQIYIYYWPYNNNIIDERIEREPLYRYRNVCCVLYNHHLQEQLKE